jgi:hypothetical protein
MPTIPRIAESASLASYLVGKRDRLAERPKTLRGAVRTPFDLMNLPNYHIYLKLMIDGTPSIPFSAETLAPGV